MRIVATVETFAQIEREGSPRLSVTFSDGEIVLQAEDGNALRLDVDVFDALAGLRTRHTEALRVMRAEPLPDVTDPRLRSGEG